jgi:two-component SAPR family response regulator
MIYRILGFLTLFFIGFLQQQANAQNYGLRFLGQSEPVLDNRTSLDLSVDGTICADGDLELSFQLSFIAKSRSYFGYILRLVDERAQNIDLMLSDADKPGVKQLRVIVGERFSNISFSLNKDQLFDHWNQLKLKISKTSNSVELDLNGRSLLEKKVDLAGAGCFRILFGANAYSKFKTADVPDMRIKNIRLMDDGKAMHFWPLDEVTGNTAIDSIHHLKAKADNPRWIRSMHYNWEQVNTLTVKGNASVAFDPRTEDVHIIAADALYRYTVSNGKQQVTKYKDGQSVFLQGNQSVFDTTTGKLHNLNIDRKRVSTFDPVTATWSQKWAPNERITKFWHFNKFIANGSLYVLGGYGELEYKNLVQQSDLTDAPWRTIPVDSNIYGPRYLAALGTGQNKRSAYMIGGYGSLTGSQMLNPHNYYDLIRFDIKNNSFTQVYKLPYPDSDFAFANSLVIDQKNDAFYGLIFPDHRSNSTLQLIKGSLTKPEYQLMGNKIPYQFFDIRSYADLYYCSTSKKLVAVTLFRISDSLTNVKIYTIGFPPNMLQSHSKANNGRPWMIYILIGFTLAGVAFFAITKNAQRSHVPSAAKPASAVPDTATLTDAVPDPISPEPEKIGDDIKVSSEPLLDPAVQKSSILLFGNLEVIDKKGNSITRLFTPLLKELFLLLLVFSIRRKTGVSSEKLNEILWFDKSKKDALNNRSVNIARLKAILEDMGDCRLSKTTGYWKIEVDPEQIHIDYHDYLQIVNTKQVLVKAQIERLFDIIRRGTLLLDTDYEWLDEFKAEAANEIIDRLLLFARSVEMTAEPDILIQTTNHIFHFDPVNEDAMQIQCKVLALLGKHSVSKNVYEKFVREYRHIYGEDYDRSFQSVIE